MNTLYIRLPSKAAITALPESENLYAFAYINRHRTSPEQEGVASLLTLAPLIGRAKKTVLLIAACDVTVLYLQLPALSASRLKAALPYLVEEQLLDEPENCLIASAPAGNVLKAGLSAALSVVAVTDRHWLQQLISQFQQYGARHIQALASQLCLVQNDAAISVAVSKYAETIDLALRLSEQQNIGVAINLDQFKQDAAPELVLQTVLALTSIVQLNQPNSTSQINLYVPETDLFTYQQAVNRLLATPLSESATIKILSDQWAHWIEGAAQVQPELAKEKDSDFQVDWARWRWSIWLGVALVVMNLLALNLDWWRLKREENRLRNQQLQAYKIAYPKATVIVDPLAQIQQKIRLARRAAGQAMPEDFAALTANFSAVWAGLQSSSNLHNDAKNNTSNHSVNNTDIENSIATLSYNNHTLTVTFKTDNPVPLQQADAALRAAQLLLTQQDARTWKIRSAV